MTVMDRLVAELGGIETAIVTLQEQVNIFYRSPEMVCIAIEQPQVTRGLNCGWNPFSGENE